MIRAADHDIATGVWPDMTEHGAVTDAWPQPYEKVLAADILVLAGRPDFENPDSSPSCRSRRTRSGADPDQGLRAGGLDDANDLAAVLASRLDKLTAARRAQTTACQADPRRRDPGQRIDTGRTLGR
ncbi:MAG: hypothetical protein ACRDNT_07550 [Streptosporangiaceae bacterium]